MLSSVSYTTALAAPLFNPSRPSPSPSPSPSPYSYQPPCPPLVCHRQLSLRLPHIQALPSNSSHNAAPSIDFGNGKGLSRYSMEIELQVRDYELDKYGVVNNAVYSSYCEHAFFQFQGKIGLSGDTVARTGYNQALKERHLKFCAPLKSGDKFIIQTRMSYCTIARAFLQQLIYKLPNKELVLESNSIVVWLDNSYRPIRMPEKLKHHFIQLGLFKC